MLLNTDKDCITEVNDILKEANNTLIHLLVRNFPIGSEGNSTMRDVLMKLATAQGKMQYLQGQLVKS